MQVELMIELVVSHLEERADGAEVVLVLGEGHVLERAGAVGQRGVVGAEEDGDCRDGAGDAGDGAARHTRRPARVVAAVAAQHDVGGAGVVVRQRRAPAALPERLLRDGVAEQHDRRPHFLFIFFIPPGCSCVRADGQGQDRPADRRRTGGCLTLALECGPSWYVWVYIEGHACRRRRESATQRLRTSSFPGQRCRFG